MRRSLLTLFVLLATVASAVGAASAASGSRSRWPFHSLQLGVVGGAGQAPATAKLAPFGLRYQYLSGGVNTGGDWEHWQTGGTSFVTSYISESEKSHLVPVFTLYELRQSQPGAGVSNEASADLQNLADRSTMRAYYENVKAFFEAAAKAKGPVVLQVEPDLFGYIEQAAKNNNASEIPAAVSDTGMPDLRGMPNTAAGFAQAILTLRRNYAPKVLVGYSLSIWGTGTDIHLDHPYGSQLASMAAKAAVFYRSLYANYDLVFTEVADRDAGYAQNVNGEGTTAWWNSSDYEHDQQFLKLFHSRVRRPLVMWQIPLGNTVMRTMNNTTYHYQDNHVQWYLGTSDGRSHLRGLMSAGVVALLFGSGQGNDTDIYDAAHDGVTNPKPIDGNTRRSHSSADDGGYFAAQARAYYHAGALRLPSPQPQGAQATRRPAQRHTAMRKLRAGLGS